MQTVMTVTVPCQDHSDDDDSTLPGSINSRMRVWLTPLAPASNSLFLPLVTARDDGVSGHGGGGGGGCDKLCKYNHGVV